MRDIESKLTPTQKVVHEQIVKATEELRWARATAEAEVRKFVAERVRAAEGNRDSRVIAGRAEGMSFAQLKRAMDTRDHATVKRILGGFIPELNKPRTAFEVDTFKQTITINFVEWDKKVYESETNEPLTLSYEYHQHTDPRLGHWSLYYGLTKGAGDEGNVQPLSTGHPIVAEKLRAHPVWIGMNASRLVEVKGTPEHFTNPANPGAVFRSWTDAISKAEAEKVYVCSLDGSELTGYAKYREHTTTCSDCTTTE